MSVPHLPAEAIAKLAHVFAAYPELTRVILYGSRATGTATDRSDVDLATQGINDDHRLGRLALDLEDVDIPQVCDLRAYEAIANTSLRHHIDTHGITIYTRPTPTQP